MAKLGDLIAFRAAISLLKKSKNGRKKITAIYKACKKAIKQPKEKLLEVVPYDEEEGIVHDSEGC